jgi:hypothetical protein
MSGTLFFIHGTGVRQAGFDDTMQRLADGLKQAGRTDIQVKGYPWGDKFGVQIDDAALNAVLPPALAKAADGDAAQWEAALWEQLLDDPLFELRMAAIREVAAPDSLAAPLPGTATLPDVVVSDRVSALPAKLKDPLPGGVTAAALGRAARDIGGSAVLAQAAVAAPGPDDTDLNQAISRAIVAEALAASRGEPGTGPDALYVFEQRRQLVQTIAGLLLPATKGLGGWLSNSIKGAAEALATGYAKKRREVLVAGAGPGVGDILLYQRRGAAILDAIEAEIIGLAAEAGPVIALGHSLGGIMLVDLLSRPRAAGPLPIGKLITVGSQSPAFFECDALGTMRPRVPLPAGLPFTPWLNVYDRNDFLSFCASRCFPGAPAGIEDFEISSGVSFPDAHSAYFRQAALFAKIVEQWP